MTPTQILTKTGLVIGVALLTACGMWGYGSGGAYTTGGLFKRQFHVQLVECVGSASLQNVTAVLTITNDGPDTGLYIGGNSDGSLAVDNLGNTSKPYSSAGRYYKLPYGVTVKVEVERIGPVRPGTSMFQILSVSVGSGENSVVSFRRVPIAWAN